MSQRGQPSLAVACKGLAPGSSPTFGCLYYQCIIQDWPRGWIFPFSLCTSVPTSWSLVGSCQRRLVMVKRWSTTGSSLRPRSEKWMNHHGLIFFAQWNITQVDPNSEMSSKHHTNMFAPTRALLQTYSRHDHHHHRHHHHHHHIMIIIIIIIITSSHHHIITSSHHHIITSSHHHIMIIMIIITLKFTPSEQYVDWGHNIHYVSIRDQNLPPPMNNMLAGVITSTLSSSGIKICHPLMNNMLIWVVASTWSCLQTRRNVRVAANMFDYVDGFKYHTSNSLVCLRYHSSGWVTSMFNRSL